MMGERAYKAVKADGSRWIPHGFRRVLGNTISIPARLYIKSKSWQT